MFGICLGHQILCRAFGRQTFKLFGHRGANQPVKDLRAENRHHLAEPWIRRGGARRASQRIEGDEPVRWETDFGTAELLPNRRTSYDRTVQRLLGGENEPLPPCAE